MKRLTVRRLSVLLIVCMAVHPLAAQSFIPERDTSATSLFEYATKTPKHNKAFNLDLEMHATFNTLFAGGRFDEAAFRFNQIKLEATGEVNDRLFYWYRQSLNQSNRALELENMPESIEYALIGFRVTDRFTITAGKQPIDFGGFEYDLNPLEIYEYSDMNEYTACYFTGVSFAYQLTDAQEVRLQITDNRLGSMENTYGVLPEGIKKPKAPLYYTANWNSSYFDELLNLRYSFTAGEQAAGKWMYTAWAGQNIAAGALDFYFDVMYMRGALDQLGLLSEMGETEEEETNEPARPAMNTEYLSLVAEMNYRFHPKWNLFVKGAYETASIYKATDFYDKGSYRTSWCYQGGMEFFPMADDNLHIFLAGTGRAYSLSSRADALGASIDNTARLSLGFIYKLPLF